MENKTEIWINTAEKYLKELRIKDAKEIVDYIKYLPDIFNEDFEKFDFRKWMPKWDNSIVNTKTINKLLVMQF